MVPGTGPLARVPAVAAFVAVIAVFVAGVLLGGFVGAVLLGLLALAVALLLATTWTRLSPAERTGRVLALGLLVAVAVLQVGR